MLKINKKTNFDPLYISSKFYNQNLDTSIFDASMYGDFDFIFDLNNECEDCDFNNTEQVRKAYIESRIDSLLWKLNLYNDNRIWKYHQYEINKMINELKSYGVEIIERKDLKKYIK